LNILSVLFGVGVGFRNSLYDRGLSATRRLAGPVVSIGNLSVGGSGKTPFVLLLGGLLKTRGVPFDVLSRGYGRKSKGVASVDPAGSAADFGDEPLLISRRLQVPVVVGEDRYEAGMEAEKSFGVQLHLLDDGFQHRQLARDLDIVLVTPEDANDKLMPGGRLREPLSSLKRADVVVLAGGAAAENFPLTDKEVWRVRRNIAAVAVPEKPVVFCGIARPEHFLFQLKLAGVEAAAQALYRDHHSYSEKDIRDLLELAKKSEAGGFVTTEKDAINLGGYLSALKPMTVVPVKMELLDETAALDTILRTIGAGRA
jgi:tetraacyldisaccharide 4'-kinase